MPCREESKFPLKGEIEMKKGKCKLFVYLFLSFCFIGTPNAVLAQDVIKIGALYPLSGAMALLGTHASNGTELATTMINERGGIQGKKIVLVKADVPTAEAAR
jgi:ABC-type branched-subunit amino acid transport system substrate-binding protein